MPLYRARIRLIRAYEGDAFFEAPSLDAAKKAAEVQHKRPDAATTINWVKVGDPTFVYAHVYNSTEEGEHRANEDADPNPKPSVMPKPAAAPPPAPPLAPPAPRGPRPPPTRRGPAVKGKPR